MFSTRHVPAHDLMPPRCSVFFLCFYLIGLLQLSYNVILTNTRSLPQNVCLINFFCITVCIHLRKINSYWLFIIQPVSIGSWCFWCTGLKKVSCLAKARLVRFTKRHYMACQTLWNWPWPSRNWKVVNSFFAAKDNNNEMWAKPIV